MEDEQVKARIGANIAYYRKQAGLTQVGLAEKLNYSDKAVSKWERGDSIPDVLTLEFGYPSQQFVLHETSRGA